ncbi:hypothetical protein [Winogradskyella immobilis]|uniref:Uncharacterized protein n=1 Tax=Winogradskyella immobilis TaxID=2816852 RepID=A0ABS8EQI9_9FLAO|nr:hypothetical protein [Winogradskyella immobilis]MCC1485107.1 hypothetical protein [Winogradskyella immobilis]MCG0017199.1 hypothetical protein [Winogradskyella immobilis]
MKTTIKTSQYVIMCILLIPFLRCSNDDSDPGPGDGEIQQINGISAEDLDNYLGDLGVLINARDLKKKGYNPTKVNVTTSASQGDYDQQIDINEYTNIAQLSIAVEDLTEAAEEELRNGVDLNIEILDDTNSVISTESFTVVSFEENGNQVDINATPLDFVTEDLNFKEGMRHYLQIVNSDGSYGSAIVNKPGSGSTANTLLNIKQSSFNPGTTSEQYFIYKFPDEENTFTIWSAITNRYLATDLFDKTFRQSGFISYPTGISDRSLNPIYKFKIKRAANGLFTISDMDDNPMRRAGSNWRTNGTGPIEYFRIIALDVEWETQVLDTEHLEPIFPSVDTSFGFNSTLRNCGSGSLEQEVGIQREVTTTYTTSQSETIGLSGRVTTSVDVSVSATAEASFFGNGGSVTGEVSAGLEVSVEASSTSTVGLEQSNSETNTFFSNRTVTVPAGSASLIYDAYQTYSNVRIPYVKRLRLKGEQNNNGSGSLSGQEIATQLRVTNFSGVITSIGSDFVEINIRGNMFLDNIVDTLTEVQDVEANCN